MNEENTVISSREEHCLQVLPTQVNVRIYAIHTSVPNIGKPRFVFCHLIQNSKS